MPKLRKPANKLRPRNAAVAVVLIAVSSTARAQQPGNVAFSAQAAIEQQRKSLLEQRASLKRQMGESNFASLLGVTFYGMAPRPAYFAPCPPLDLEKRERLITEAARKQSIEPDLLRAVMHHESGFRACAVSVKGALGLMQLMPATIARFDVKDPFDPFQNIQAGAALLRSLIDTYHGDLKLALAAYNAGSARIDNASPDTYPLETKSYIAGILKELGATSDSP